MEEQTTERKIYESPLNLCEKLTSSKCWEIKPKELADALNACFKSRDYDRVRFYRDCYVVGLSKQCAESSIEFIRANADGRTVAHAGFADLVNERGYVDDEHIKFTPHDGPVAKFVEKALKPKHKTRERRYLFW